MSVYPAVTIDPKKVANIIFRHPWIFSGAIVGMEEEVKHGTLVSVKDPEGKILGVGTFSETSSIAVRVLDFHDAVIDRAWFGEKFREADARRKLLGYGPKTDTTGYRVVFGESDGVPGLVLDRYEDVLVFQMATAGLDARRDEIIEALQEVFSPHAIIERSDLPSRREEQLEDSVKIHFSDFDAIASKSVYVNFQEFGLRFIADVTCGQKTGFFLDQKDTRAAVCRLAHGRKILNLFSYTGATGIAAMKGGALSVHNVDGSEAALAGCQKHAEVNGIDLSSFTTEKADMFQWLAQKNEPAYDMVICDPPALIKSRRDEEEGKKAYHFLNRAALRLVKDGGILATSSCSRYLPEEDLAFILRRASVQAGVSLSTLRVVHQSPDHPVSVYFPEAAYLKTLVCQVNRP